MKERKTIMNKGSITILLSALLSASACGEAETLNDGEVRHAKLGEPAKLVELEQPGDVVSIAP